jgi:hypothetical protein
MIDYISCDGYLYNREGTKGKYLPVLKNNMRLVSLPEAKKPAFAAGLADAGTQPQAVIILSACMEGHYKDAKAIGDRLGAPVIVLNAPYSYRYDIGKLSKLLVPSMTNFGFLMYIHIPNGM